MFIPGFGVGGNETKYTPRLIINKVKLSFNEEVRR